MFCYFSICLIFILFLILIIIFIKLFGFVLSFNWTYPCHKFWQSKRALIIFVQLFRKYFGVISRTLMIFFVISCSKMTKLKHLFCKAMPHVIKSCTLEVSAISLQLLTDFSQKRVIFYPWFLCAMSAHVSDVSLCMCLYAIVHIDVVKVVHFDVKFFLTQGS